MKIEPALKRTIAFVNGQNLFHNVAKRLRVQLSQLRRSKACHGGLCVTRLELEWVQFYTGVPSPTDNAFWHGFWANKLAMMDVVA